MIRIDVEVLDGDKQHLPGTLTKTIQDGADRAMKKKLSEDQYIALKGDERARVSVPVAQTQGGPGYSSIKIGVELSITVNQDAESIRTAASLLMSEGLVLIDAHIRPAYDILLQHRAELDAMVREKEKAEMDEEDPFT